MKKYLLMTVAALLIAAPVTAWSQNASPATGSNEPQSQSNQGGQGNMTFADKKADILKHMNERLADQQKRIACVQSASDKDSMRACMPKRGDWGHQDGMHHGMGMKPADGQGSAPGDMPPPDDNGPAK